MELNETSDIFLDSLIGPIKTKQNKHMNKSSSDLNSLTALFFHVQKMIIFNISIVSTKIWGKNLLQYDIYYSLCIYLHIYELFIVTLKTISDSVLFCLPIKCGYKMHDCGSDAAVTERWNESKWSRVEGSTWVKVLCYVPVFLHVNQNEHSFLFRCEQERSTQGEMYSVAHFLFISPSCSNECVVTVQPTLFSIFYK